MSYQALTMILYLVECKAFYFLLNILVICLDYLNNKLQLTGKISPCQANIFASST